LSYNDLSVTMQNVISYNSDFMMKFIFISVFLIFSAYYLFYYKPNLEKKTALWSAMLLRIFLTGFSFFGLMFSPFILLMLQPTFSFDSLFTIYGAIYGSLLLVFMFIMLLDFSRWSLILLLKMTGMDVNSESYRNFMRWKRIYFKR